MATALLLVACGSPVSTEPQPVTSSSPPPTATEEPTPSLRPAMPTREPLPRKADLQVVFFGNSHTARHDVPALVVEMIRAQHPDQTVWAWREPSYVLLNERGSHRPSLQTLARYEWDVVVLQGQNYSSSGTATYPTLGAERLIREAQNLGALPVLYAEWARRGIDETDRILEVYDSIPPARGACLPPVPEAFDRALRQTDLVLHDSDGNHASDAGALLAAMILAATVGDVRPGDLPTINSSTVSAGDQALLRQVAADTLARIPADRRCPR